jgi:hypothetical protein
MNILMKIENRIKDVKMMNFGNPDFTLTISSTLELMHDLTYLWLILFACPLTDPPWLKCCLSFILTIVLVGSPSVSDSILMIRSSLLKVDASSYSVPCSLSCSSFLSSDIDTIWVTESNMFLSLSPDISSV